jgi:tetratricopeptide (TPR) repeat protein
MTILSLHLTLWVIVSLLMGGPTRSAPSKTVHFIANPPVDRLLPGFTDALAARLGEYGLQLERAGNEPDAQLRIVAQYECARADCIQMTITPLHPDELPLSAALAARHDYPLLARLPLEPTAAEIAEAVDLALAIALYSADRCPAAEPILTAESALWVVPPDPRPFYAGNCALLAGDFEAAAALFEQGISPYSEAGQLISSAPAVNLAWLAIQRGDSAAGMHWLDELRYAERANAVDVLAQRARLHALRFDYDEAVVLLDLAIEQQPDDPALYTLRGQLALTLYEWERVEADYNRALALDPIYAEAYFYRGVLYYSILQTGLMREAALADFTRYLELAPGGEHASTARNYIDSIRAELEALGE